MTNHILETRSSCRTSCGEAHPPSLHSAGVPIAGELELLSQVQVGVLNSLKPLVHGLHKDSLRKTIESMCTLRHAVIGRSRHSASSRR